MQPLVSVRVVTYNQEKYLAQCLEGILMQRTDFPFEIIIGEDCSTDRTRAIVVAYQQKYPEKIKALLQPQNLGGGHNNLQVQQACQGKYHAMCEGDDYWIDPLKLQKQVDFMEAHPDISLCFHNAFTLDEFHAAVRLFFETPPGETLDFEAVCQIKTPTASVMARSSILATLPDWRLKIWCGDVVFRLWCAHHGNLGYLDKVMSVYRVHPGGAVARNSRQENKRKTSEEEVFLYKQLDRDTNYLHTVALQAQVKRVQERYRRNQNLKAYYLTHPAQILRRLREYKGAIQRYRSIKYRGNLD